MTILSAFRKRSLFICAAALLTSCAATDVAQREPGSRPENKSTDEAGIWRQMEKAEQRARTSGERIYDKKLNDYIHNIQCKIAPEYCDDIRIYVMQRPYSSATMAPNGYMEVWSGLLLRSENEAQLAFVLGHETGHFEENHSLEQWRTMRNTANALMIVSVAGAAAGVGLVGDLGYLVAIASLFAFSREKEEEADLLGIIRLDRAGYAASEAAKSWENLIAEVEDSSFRSKKRKIARASIFSTHPVTKERVRYLTEKAKTLSYGTKLGQDQHIAVISPFLENWFREDLRLKDYGTSLHLLTRYEKAGIRPGLVYYMTGEAYRLRREDGDNELAIGAYQKATKYADTPAAAHRALADFHVKKGEDAAALKSYRVYLDKAPAAPDKELIVHRIQTLQRKLAGTGS